MFSPTCSTASSFCTVRRIMWVSLPCYTVSLEVCVITLSFLTKRTAFLVELFPFHIRARGITIFQLWSRSAMFVTEFVDPIGINAAGMFSPLRIRLVTLITVTGMVGWKYYLM